MKKQDRVSSKKSDQEKEDTQDVVICRIFNNWGVYVLKDIIKMTWERFLQLFGKLSCGQESVLRDPRVQIKKERVKISESNISDQ